MQDRLDSGAPPVTVFDAETISDRLSTRVTWSDPTVDAALSNTATTYAIDLGVNGNRIALTSSQWGVVIGDWLYLVYSYDPSGGSDFEVYLQAIAIDSSSSTTDPLGIGTTAVSIGSGTLPCCAANRPGEDARLVIAWVDPNSRTPYQILVADSRYAFAPTNVADMAGHSACLYPAIALNTNGDVSLVYQAETGSVTLDDGDVVLLYGVYSACHDASSTSRLRGWTTPTRVDDTATSDESAQFPSVATSDDDDTMMIVWRYYGAVDTASGDAESSVYFRAAEMADYLGASGEWASIASDSGVGVVHAAARDPAVWCTRSGVFFCGYAEGLPDGLGPGTVQVASWTWADAWSTGTVLDAVTGLLQNYPNGWAVDDDGYSFVVWEAKEEGGVRNTFGKLYGAWVDLLGDRDDWQMLPDELTGTYTKDDVDPTGALSTEEAADTDYTGAQKPCVALWGGDHLDPVLFWVEGQAGATGSDTTVIYIGVGVLESGSILD